MLKPELINSASEDENNGIEECWWILLRLYKAATVHVRALCFKRVREKKKKKKKTTQERNDKIQKKTLVGLEILSCSCGKYKPMATHAESICCLDKYEISESYFKGILSFVFEIFLSSDLLRKK